MKPIWLVEDYALDDSAKLLMEEVSRQGMECREIKYIPFVSGNYDDICKEDDCVIFQGSLNLGMQLQRQTAWIPGVFCNLDSLKCSRYYSYWGNYCLNKDHAFMTVRGFLDSVEESFDRFRTDDLFIRPDCGNKSFTGKVISREDKDFSWMTDFTNPYDFVLISTAKNILSEYRFVVGGGEVIAGCKYKEKGRIFHEEGYPSSALSLAHKIANHSFKPDYFFVVDICNTENGYYLLEANSFSCSGLYKCNLKAIVEKVSEMSLRELTRFYI